MCQCGKLRGHKLYKFTLLDEAQNVSAVDGACTLIPRLTANRQ